MLDWLIKKFLGDTLPDDDVIRWLFAAYEWIFRYHGGFDRFLRERSLIAPLNQNFPGNAEGHARAEEIFHQVKAYAGLREWPCALEAHDDARYRQLETQRDEQWTTGAAGTFSMDWQGRNAVVTYSPRQLEKLPALVATFAHELGHYFLANSPVDPPRGPKAEEPVTDLCAVYFGFGIFLANSAQDYSHGAVSSRLGYLSELTLAYALAIFTELHSISPQDVMKHLRSNPRSYFESAVRDINTRWNPEMRQLRRT